MMRVRAALFSMFLCAASGTLSAATPLPDAPHVVVSASGQSHAAPDEVLLRLSVNIRASTALAAKQEADAAVNRFLAVLEKHDVPAANVRASALHLSENIEYENGRRLQAGYRAERDVSVKIERVDNFNTLIDEGLAAGMTQIQSIDFRSSREKELRLEARRLAAENSRRRAEELAAAYGARLGPVYSINSAGADFSTRFQASNSLDQIMTSGSRRSEPPRYLQPRIDFQENVTVVFELLR